MHCYEFDLEAIRKIKAGDKKQFTTLLEKYSPVIERAKAKYHIDGYDDDDIAQVVRMSIWEAVNTFDEERSTRLSGRVQTFIKNAVINLKRQRNATDRRSSEFVEFNEFEHATSATDHDFFLSMSKTFTGIHSQIFDLIQQDFNKSEIAEILGKSRKTIRKHIVLMQNQILATN